MNMDEYGSRRKYEWELSRRNDNSIYILRQVWLTNYLLRLSSSGWIPVMDTVAEFEQPGEVQPKQENEYKVDGVTVKSDRIEWQDPLKILGDVKYKKTRSYAMLSVPAQDQQTATLSPTSSFS